METQDLAIKYKALYQEIVMILDNIKEIGFNISEYQTMLNNITNKVNENIKVNYVKGFAKASYEQDYARGISELQSLKNYLDKYDTYFRVLNSSRWVSMKCKDKNIEQESLDKYVSEMIYNLKQLVSSDTTDYDNEKHIVDEVYDTAYNLIKLELMMTGDSQLYRYAKNSDINASYFNMLIKKDIRRQSKNLKLKEKLYEISKQGIGSSYFDLELIKILLVGDNNLDFKKVIVSNIKDVSDEIENSTKRIDKMIDEVNEDVNNIDGYKEDMKDNMKEIRKNITTYLLTLSLIITGGVGIQKGVKTLATEDTYLETTEIYSSITDDVTTNEVKV